MRKRGFTLVELLVVMAVISLLVSMLVPALISVRERARVINCGANLKTIGLGLHAYAQSNNDMLMAPQFSTAAPWQSFMAYSESTGNQPMQLAILYDRGFVGENPRVLYCPGNPGEFSSYVEGGAYGTVFHGSLVKSSYSYVPQTRETDRHGLPVIATKPRTTEIDNRRAIVVDRIDTWNTINHRDGSGPVGLNGLFGDGSVRFANDSTVMDYALWHPNGPASPLGPGSNDIAMRTILSRINQ